MPKSGYTGTDSFTYDDVQNGVTSNVATVTISVNPKTLYVTNTGDSGPGSLRQAPDRGGCVQQPGRHDRLQALRHRAVRHRARLAAAGRSHPTIINGYSQPGPYTNTLSTGDNAIILVQVDGSSSGGADGLVLSGGDSTVEGLSITRFSDAILLTGSGGDTITGNFLGTGPSGTQGTATRSASRSRPPATRSAAPSRRCGTSSPATTRACSSTTALRGTPSPATTSALPSPAGTHRQ